jgi:hypothetical protein
MMAPNDDFLARARIIRHRLKILAKIHGLGGDAMFKYAEVPATGSRLLICPACDLVCEIGRDIDFEAFAMFGVFPFDDVEKMPLCESLKKQSTKSNDTKTPEPDSDS